jgi:hypothetical protein
MRREATGKPCGGSTFKACPEPVERVQCSTFQSTSPFQSFTLSSIEGFNRGPSTLLRGAQDRRSVQIVEVGRPPHLIDQAEGRLPLLKGQNVSV